MKVAIIGGGISGLAAAHTLQHDAEVTLFEAARSLGGHTDTHAILTNGRTYRVDTGFIVFNEANYPGFSRWLQELGVESRPSDMSFGVSNLCTGRVYGTRNLGALLARPANLLSRRFIAMLRDLRRFYREAPGVDGDDARSLGRYLQDHGYGPAFVEDHMVPMCAALWSLPGRRALDVPVAHVVAFMTHHRMLQLAGRPQWRVVAGGSDRYVSRFVKTFQGHVRTHDGVVRIVRQPDQVLVTSRSGRHRFDRIVLACHSDQALQLLDDASTAERDILGAIPYQRNVAVLHSDPSVMPALRRAWSSWNAVVSEASAGECQVTYWMNRLQSMDESQPFFVTLNPRQELRQVWSRREYHHPIFTHQARRAQRRLTDIDGVRNTWYAGAYWGWGFHEDGFASGVRAARAMLQASVHAA